MIQSHNCEAFCYYISQSANTDEVKNWEHKDLPAYFINTKKGKPAFSWTKFNYKGKVYFKTEEKEIPNASVDIKTDFNDIVKNMKKDSIWQKLELK